MRLIRKQRREEKIPKCWQKSWAQCRGGGSIIPAESVMVKLQDIANAQNVLSKKNSITRAWQRAESWRKIAIWQFFFSCVTFHFLNYDVGDGRFRATIAARWRRRKKVNFSTVSRDRWRSESAARCRSHSLASPLCWRRRRPRWSCTISNFAIKMRELREELFFRKWEREREAGEHSGNEAGGRNEWVLWSVDSDNTDTT